MSTQEQPDEIEKCRNAARLYSVSTGNKQDQLLVSAMELMQSVALCGTSSRSLPLKIQAHTMECETELPQILNERNDLRALHYGMAHHLSRVDNLGHLLVNCLNLMRDVAASGFRAQALPIKIQALSLECAQAKNEDLNRDDESRALHYAYTSAICALLKILSESADQQSNIDIENSHDCTDSSINTSLNESSPPEPVGILKQSRLGSRETRGTSVVEDQPVASDDPPSLRDMRSARGATVDSTFDTSADSQPPSTRRQQRARSVRIDYAEDFQPEEPRGKRARSRAPSVAPEKRRSQGEGPVECPECGASILHRHNLVRHRRDKHNVFPYNCEECDETFKVQKLLTDHKKAVHSRRD